MNRRTLLAGAAALSALIAAPAMAQDEPLKVGFIYVGPVGDGGWTYQHDLGRQAVEAEYGDRVETTFIESVPEGADAERALTQLALAGNKLIFATSFGFMDPTINVASKFPDVKFEHATGYKRADNVATYDARFYEGRAVIGTIAGRMTESNKIGYIGSFPIPEVIQGINSSFIHARKVNPDVEMKVVWAYSWFDPAKEADAASALLAEGVDVILQHTDSTAPLAKAQEAGAIGFGQASDMAAFAPSPRVASIIDNWAPYYVERVGEVLDGTWESKATWAGIGDGEVVIGDITEAVPAEVKAEAEALRDSIGSGEYHPFTGPLNKADGSVWLAEGETASDEDLQSMNFYVEGITAQIPQ
ncbi:BMP family ABC transporter substrate-binding protein [Paracoccus sp. 1_MG-2023]|uniref:BMP family ABC transporter substrate-binding protein n=1 Tax=unclassified Paracoccus (in: a-proteobacteria) TaxID=2688777 RepID=UPI001C080249|nr:MULTISPECIES: BMP family ABC transporter substrate-binding protein [unclassified Paracoccus (in: a-proteobacteria)]MBU2957512.1 BMP family ABC transporter substrate-binding protein [Paracoccus sp. C2R09]MDO6670186.1 BMP family ABC transporter substrate-binding protein [Paracoccus sp. 1_MG-2023]